MINPKSGGHARQVLEKQPMGNNTNDETVDGEREHDVAPSKFLNQSNSNSIHTIQSRKDVGGPEVNAKVEPKETRCQDQT